MSGTLYRANLIYEEPRELRKNNGNLELIVIFRDVSSFKYWITAPPVVEYWSGKFHTLLSGPPKTIQETNVIVEVDSVTNCTCTNPEFYILQGRSLQFTDELICGTCSGQIPYSRIPTTIEIENWQRHYQRVYLNWLDSSIFEEEACKELTNYKDGKLNLEGEKIRKQLSDHFGIPVYLELFSELPE